MFHGQDAFVLSKAKYRTGDCSRRAGKTEGAAGVLFSVRDKPGAVALYITKTRVNAKRIIWETLKRFNRDFNMGGQVLEAELCIRFKNGAAIYLAGASNREEIEKFRGLPIFVVVVDEAQTITGYLVQLIDDVLAPALMDFDGSLVLLGTPAPVPSGYFYDCINNQAWEHHHWTFFDNPHIARKSGKSHQQLLDAECQRRGVTVDDPSIQREYFGKWAYDPNALVFRYDAGTNDYDELPTGKGDWECLVCGDIGFDDSDALAVLKWNTTRPDLWLAEESVLPKQTITQLGNRLQALVAAYNPLTVVLDTGALGKKIAAELTSRWALKIEAAEKERKLEHIELLNDALRTGTFHAKKDSRFAQDCMLVEWDRENPEKPKVSDRYHSDIADAVLYGYRRAKQWLYVPTSPPLPKPGSAEWREAKQQLAEAEDSRLEQEFLEQGRHMDMERQDAAEDMEMLF